jgi:hypothetical protein
MTTVRRVTSGLMIAMLLVAASAAPAVAWSNGVDGPNSFGTHDWILKKAIKAAGEGAGWVRVRVALKATDDPDTVDGIDHASGTWWHVYDRWGEEWGGADEAARVWFRRMQRRLEAGRERAASKALGYLAHIVGDVAQPMHTDSSDKEDDIHSSYEQAVDRRLHRYRFRYDSADPAKAGPRTRAVARRAHKSYWALVNAYDAHGYNREVHRITKRQLNRAANALADLL